MKDRTCDHCGREVTSKAANGTLIRVPIPLPTDHNIVIGHQELLVCNPTVRYRPRCYRLVAMYGHGGDCQSCYRNYPPGAELRVIPEEGMWAVRDRWLIEADAA